MILWLQYRFCSALVEENAWSNRSIKDALDECNFDAAMSLINQQRKALDRWYLVPSEYIHSGFLSRLHEADAIKELIPYQIKSLHEEVGRLNDYVNTNSVIHHSSVAFHDEIQSRINYIYDQISASRKRNKDSESETSIMNIENAIRSILELTKRIDTGPTNEACVVLLNEIEHSMTELYDLKCREASDYQRHLLETLVSALNEGDSNAARAAFLSLCACGKISDSIKDLIINIIDLCVAKEFINSRELISNSEDSLFILPIRSNEIGGATQKNDIVKVSILRVLANFIERASLDAFSNYEQAFIRITLHLKDNPPDEETFGFLDEDYRGVLYNSTYYQTSDTKFTPKRTLRGAQSNVTSLEEVPLTDFFLSKTNRFVVWDMTASLDQNRLLFEILPARTKLGSGDDYNYVIKISEKETTYGFYTNGTSALGVVVRFVVGNTGESQNVALFEIESKPPSQIYTRQGQTGGEYKERMTFGAIASSIVMGEKDAGFREYIKLLLIQRRYSSKELPVSGTILEYIESYSFFPW